MEQLAGVQKCRVQNRTDLKCLKQENRLDKIGWDNISRCDLRVIMKLSKVKHQEEALYEPKARLY